MMANPIAVATAIFWNSRKQSLNENQYGGMMKNSHTALSLLELGVKHHRFDAAIHSMPRAFE